jgi:putative inorganic carbon (HCO3(-)) transporter
VLSFIKLHKEKLLLTGIILSYIFLNSWLISKEFLFFMALPVVVFFVFLAFTRLDITYFAIIALTPLSVQLIEFLPNTPIDFYIPTEPMLFGVMLIVIFKSIRDPFFDRRIFNHPVSYAILANLIWLLLTSITSTMPLVSFKFLLARIWFIITFYLLAVQLFKNPENISKLVWAYVLPMLIVIAYAWVRHIKIGLYDDKAAHYVMNPFYRDHTSYGAMLAMVLFPFIAVILLKKHGFIFRTFKLGVLAILFVALVLSYTRAAWISVVFSAGLLIPIIWRVKFKYLLVAGAAIAGLIILNQSSLERMMTKNDQDSSDKLTEHVKSISNIATDASNLERINRWASALRMFKEKPVLGWGPGTYMFQYAPFQRSYQRTYVSTNYGDMGNAHSEYIGPLSESGVLGALTIILVIIVSLTTAFRVYRRIDDKALKRLVLGLILGYITYIFHGMLNNFLDTDKASSLFWGYTAVFVSLDLFYKSSAMESSK